MPPGLPGPAGPAGPDGAGQDRTARLLAEALAGDLAGPVDSAGLLAGARPRAVRLRRRRAVTAAAAFLAVPALAVGSSPQFLPGPGATSPAGPPSSPVAPDATVPDATVPTPSPLPSSADPRTSLLWSSDGTRVVVPRDSAPGEDSLGEDYQKLEGSEDREEIRATGESPCASLPGSGSLAVGGRSITIGKPDPDDPMPDEWSLHAATRVFLGHGAEEQILWLNKSLATGEGVARRASTAVEVERVDDEGTAVLAHGVGIDPRRPCSVTVPAAVRVGRATTGFALSAPARIGGDREERVTKALSTAMGLLSLAGTRLESSGPGLLSSKEIKLGETLGTPVRDADAIQ
jgi:hypothetical protein